MVLVGGAVRRRRRGAAWVLLALAVLAVAVWGGVLALAGLPRTDAEGRGVLFVWQRTSGWWQGVLTLVASTLTMVLAVWLPVVAVRRWVAAPWRALAASVGAVLVLVVGGYLAVSSFVSLALSGAEGTQTLVTGADGRRVLVTRDGFDGDVVQVWQPADRVTWLRDPVATTIDPQAGPCRLTSTGEGTTLLVCGPTAQVLAPAPTR